MRAAVIPDLIASYVGGLPCDSLVLVTHVLGATANWLLLRFLAAFAAPGVDTDDISRDTAPTGVIFLSFLRNYDFWRDGSKRLGIDLNRLAAENRLICIDGLSELFLGSMLSTETKGSLKPTVRGDHVVIRDAKLENVEKSVLDLISRMNKSGSTSTSASQSTPKDASNTSRTLLIVDGIDFLMAALEETDSRIQDTIMAWRENTHSLIVTTSADAPLIHDAQTSLEINHRNLVVTLAQQARYIASLKLLDSGTAKDVSGVLKFNRGAYADDSVDENEFLYFVSGDGNVKVFERGASKG